MSSAPQRTAASANLKVFIAGREVQCSDCNEDLGRQAWIFLAENRGPLCLACADLDHLAFLLSGDPAVTRRARAGSSLSAVVLKWSRSRKHYERQGLLVEAPALECAEVECLGDADARGRRRETRASLHASPSACGRSFLAVRPIANTRSPNTRASSIQVGSVAAPPPRRWIPNPSGWPCWRTCAIEKPAMARF